LVIAPPSRLAKKSVVVVIKVVVYVVYVKDTFKSVLFRASRFFSSSSVAFYLHFLWTVFLDVDKP